MRKKCLLLFRNVLVSLMIIAVCAVLAPTELVVTRGELLKGLIGSYGHTHTFVTDQLMGIPILTVGKRYPALGEVISLTVSSDEEPEYDTCTNTTSACTFLTRRAYNTILKANWSDNNSGGQFGKMVNGAFTALSLPSASNDVTHYKAPSTVKSVNISVTVDDLTSVIDPVTGVSVTTPSDPAQTSAFAAMAVGGSGHNHQFVPEALPYDPEIDSVYDEPYLLIGNGNAYVRAGERVSLTVNPGAPPEVDKCINESSPCSFPDHAGNNFYKVKSWSDNGAKGKFGRMVTDANGVEGFEELPQQRANEVTVYQAPADPKVIKITVVADDKFQHVPDPAGGTVNTANDPDGSTPNTGHAYLTAWRFTLTNSTPSGWLPKPDAQDVTFTAKFEPALDHLEPPTPMPKAMEFNLSTSSEPGYCLNKTLGTWYRKADGSYTWSDAHYMHDLKFVSGEGTGTSPEVQLVADPLGPIKANVTGSPVPTTASITVKSTDYGAHGGVEAYAKLPNDALVAANVIGRGNETLAQMPIDKNNNDIADAATYVDDSGTSDVNAKYDAYSANPDTDTDSLPQGTGIGDRLSLYEEYRGMEIASIEAETTPPNKHRRLSPKFKEVFVIDNITNYALSGSYRDDVKHRKQDRGDDGKEQSLKTHVYFLNSGEFELVINSNYKDLCQPPDPKINYAIVNPYSIEHRVGGDVTVGNACGYQTAILMEDGGNFVKSGLWGWAHTPSLGPGVPNDRIFARIYTSAIRGQYAPILAAEIGNSAVLDGSPNSRIAVKTYPPIKKGGPYSYPSMVEDLYFDLRLYLNPEAKWTESWYDPKTSLTHPGNTGPRESWFLGYLKIDNEIFTYTGIEENYDRTLTDINQRVGYFTGVTRLGDQPDGGIKETHYVDRPVKYFAKEDDLITSLYAHELGHLVNLYHRPPVWIPMTDGSRWATIMNDHFFAGYYPGTTYFHSYRMFDPNTGNPVLGRDNLTDQFKVKK